MSTSFQQSSIHSPSAPRASATERAFSVTSGALLMLPIFGKRSTLRWTAAAAGGALIYCGMSGTRATSRLTAAKNGASSKQYIKRSITIDKSAGELFTLWRNTDVLTRVIQPFGELTAIGPDHLRWCLDLGFGPKIEFEALVTDERPNELVHWRTTPASMFQVDEYMRFRPAPNGLGTEATLEYEVDFSRVPAGEILHAISSFFERAPRTVAEKILRNFKSYAETGEIPTLDRNPSARNHKGYRKGDLV